MPPSPGFPSSPSETLVEDWASRQAEQLPLADVRQLARAVAQGEHGVRKLRAVAASVMARTACDELIAWLASTTPEYLSGLLVGAARTVERARGRQSVSVVWTGPESSVTSSRLTSAAVIELINAARSEILLVSYATQTEPSIGAVLSAAVARGVTVTLLAERNADNPSYTSVVTPFPALKALRLYWPASARPPDASLHAKVIVVDDQVALVGSANLTSRAMEDNLECGILLRGGPRPKAIRSHLIGLFDAGVLHRA